MSNEEILGGAGANGTVSVRGKDGQPLVELLGRDNEAVIGLGQSGRPGRISLYGADRQEAVRIDTQGGGDIWIANGDLAEEFDLGDAGTYAGMVVVLAKDGSVVACDAEYDARVVGVVAGAGDFRPGLVLDRRTTGRRRAPVALLGKVYCWVDATVHPVRAGDLLTSSARPGHARAVAERSRALGAVVGKALAPLTTGCGLLPVLVTLH